MAEQKNKWILSFDNESRQCYITCPKCKEIYRYSILGSHKKCPQCHTDLNGIYDPSRKKAK